MNDHKFRTAAASETAVQATPAGVGEGRRPGQAGVVGPAVGRLSGETSAVTVVRRSGQGWRVGEDELPDLTSAMVLADLLAADNPGAVLARPERYPTAPLAGDPDSAAGPADPVAEAARLRVTVAQLEGALVRRVRVEQAIGIICERRRIQPRKAFELLRSQARATGARVPELAGQVVDSAANPLQMLPDELARTPREPRGRGKSPRHRRSGE
jgi:ANTAR domain